MSLSNAEGVSKQKYHNRIKNFEKIWKQQLRKLKKVLLKSSHFIWILNSNICKNVNLNQTLQLSATINFLLPQYFLAPKLLRRDSDNTICRNSYYNLSSLNNSNPWYKVRELENLEFLSLSLKKFSYFLNLFTKQDITPPQKTTHKYSNLFHFP